MKLLALLILILLGGVCGLQSVYRGHVASVEAKPNGASETDGSNTKQASLASPASINVFTAFDDWVEHKASISESLNASELAKGVNLAKERRSALLQLIAVDPKNAIAVAYSERAISRLPQEVRAQMETRISGYAELSAIVTLPKELNATPEIKRHARMNGRDYNAYVYGRRTAQAQVNNAVIYGVAVGDTLAIHENPVREIRLDEVADLDAVIDAAARADCPVSLDGALSKGDLALAEVGGRMVYLCTHGHIAELNEEQIAQEDGSANNGGIAQSSMSEGAKTLLFMRLDFSDLTGEPIDSASAQNLIDQTCSNFFQANSYGGTTLTGTVTPVLRMPQTANYYKTVSNGDTTLLSDARAAATAAGYTLSNYNLDIAAFKSVFAGWAGQGYVGGKGVWLNGYFDLRVACHELGHNFGLWHANYWHTTDNTAIGTGSNEEYGDVFDVMGGGNTTAAHHFNTYEKNVLNWLPNLNVNTVSTSGTYRVYAHDQPTLNTLNKYALKVSKDGSRYYWVELRQALTGNNWSMNGVGLRWGQWASSNGGSQLLDTTPGSAAAKDDSGIYIGRTFSDTTANVHITPIGKAGTTPESMDVVINMGSFTNNGTPMVSLASSAMYAGVGAEVTLTATASDPDNDALAYFWDFNDGSFGTSNAIQKHTWSSLGTKTVQCTVSDMKGKTATASIQVNLTATPPDQTVTVTKISNAIEAGTVGVFRLSRTGNTTQALTVTYQISGTATSVLDFTALPGTATFNANATSVDISVSALQDALFEGDENVVVTLVAGATYGVGTSGASTLTVVDIDTAQILSGITATPSTPVAQQAVQFSCASNIAGAIYSWNFGDGVVVSGGTDITHTYTSAGSYSVVVTATHPGSGTSVQSSSQLTVKPVPLLLPITRMTGSFRFNKTNVDTVSLAFNLLDIKMGFLPMGETITVTVGGFSESFSLNKSGSGRDGLSSTSLRVTRTAKSLSTLTFALKGTMTGLWATAGADFNVTARNATRKLPVSVTVGGKTYDMTPTVIFTSTANKAGTFRK